MLVKGATGLIVLTIHVSNVKFHEVEDQIGVSGI